MQQGYQVYEVRQADGTMAVLMVPVGNSVQEQLQQKYPGGTLTSPNPVYEATPDRAMSGLWSGD